jgi:outer membrane protein assembly factor BamB
LPSAPTNTEEAGREQASIRPIRLATPALLADQQASPSSSSSSQGLVVLALDVVSGKVRWSYTRGLSSSPSSSPSSTGPSGEADDATATPVTLGVSPEGGRVYLRVSGTGEVDSLDSLNGRHLWAYKPPTLATTIAEAAEPAFTSDGSVILHHDDQIMYLDASV